MAEAATKPHREELACHGGTKVKDDGAKAIAIMAESELQDKSLAPSKQKRINIGRQSWRLEAMRF